jgi:hypothetical protein
MTYTVRCLLALGLMLFFSLKSYAQIIGEELLPEGNFGTTLTVGVNEAGSGAGIYNTVTSSNPSIPTYYQPAIQAFHYGTLINIHINPRVKIGKPLNNGILYGSTDYTWGFTDQWFSDAYTFPNTSGQNTWVTIPNAPNNGNYLITTSTNGMYNLPSLSSAMWSEVYDRYETDKINATNYFFVSNADMDNTKIFYKKQLTLDQGQAYLFCVDMLMLNVSWKTRPNIAVVAATSEADLKGSAATIIGETGNLTTQGEWTTFDFLYVPECTPGQDDSTLYIGFRNNVTVTDGNDVAIDNLSIKKVTPQISLNVQDTGDGCHAVFQLDGTMNGIFDTNQYSYIWQKKENEDATYEDVSTDAAETTCQTTESGIYRLLIYNKNYTRDCAMSSNEIKINASSPCPESLRPIAEDDPYQIVSGVPKTGNILENDYNTNLDTLKKELYVTRFTVNGEVYSVNSTAIVKDDNGDQVGTIHISSNGDFVFNSLPGYGGNSVPPIPYVVVQDGYGQDTANILINFYEHDLIINDLCISCGIEAKVVAANIRPANTHSLYRDDGVNMNAVFTQPSQDTLVIKFWENTSGLMYYKLYRRDTLAFVFNVMVHPDTATWVPNQVLNNSDWNYILNWNSTTGIGSPIWCTDVIIPDSAHFYPSLTDLSPAYCRDITFKPGGSVGKIHKLSYRNAFVELDPAEDHWMMLSAPLKYMYSADYHPDPNWEGISDGNDQKIYMREFDVNYVTNDKVNPDGRAGTSIGAFSKAFANLHVLLEAGKGFVLGVETGAYFPGHNFEFPRLNDDGTDVEYKYHMKETGEWIENENARVTSDKYPFRPERGTSVRRTNADWLVNHTYHYGEDSRYRFIYEDPGDTTAVFSIAVANEGTTNIVGNPFMSLLDLHAFYENNQASIQPYFRIWNGTTYSAYVITGTEAWNYIPEADSVATGKRYISPMQAFFVQMKEGQNTIRFNPDSISVAADTLIKSTKSSMHPYENVLSIQVSMDQAENTALLIASPKANDRYDPAEDIYKLFSPQEEVPEIYTVSENQAMEMNAISTAETIKSIPLGIKTTKTGSFRISIDRASGFTSYPYLELIDTQENKRYDLNAETNFVFEKTTKEDIDGRFYLLLRKDLSSNIEEVKEEDLLNVVVEENRITVTSPLSKIKSLALYDMSGRFIYKKDKLNSFRYSIDVSGNSGIYILKTETEATIKTTKIKL